MSYRRIQIGILDKITCWREEKNVNICDLAKKD